jgi:transposase
MKILAIDLGKKKSVACLYQTETSQHRYKSLPTVPKEIHDLVIEFEPDRVVIEIGSVAGWICDLVRSLGIEIQVANTSHDAWRWKNTKRKTDKDDALRLAQLSAMNQLPTVYVPSAQVRQWRSLIEYRARLVHRQTACKNQIRAILERQAIPWPEGYAGFTEAAMDQLEDLAEIIEATSSDNLWRGILMTELICLRQLQNLIAAIEAKLDALTATDPRAKRLQTIPGVGARTAEAILAILDDPGRFQNGKQVGAYIGLVPRQYQSGQTNRQGRISGAGNPTLRALLIEVSWIGLRYNPWMREVYERVRAGSNARKKLAIVAVARRLLIRCWAMLRDKTTWQPQNLKVMVG